MKEHDVKFGTGRSRFRAREDLRLTKTKCHTFMFWKIWSYIIYLREAEYISFPTVYCGVLYLFLNSNYGCLKMQFLV